MLELRARRASKQLISLLPGPARGLAAWVRAGLGASLRRSRTGPDAFIAAVRKGVRDRLGRLVEGSPGVALFVGSGTLANDNVPRSRRVDRGSGTGLILVNGEPGTQDWPARRCDSA